MNKERKSLSMQEEMILISERRFTEGEQHGIEQSKVMFETKLQEKIDDLNLNTSCRNRSIGSRN